MAGGLFRLVFVRPWRGSCGVLTGLAKVVSATAFGGLAGVWWAFWRCLALLDGLFGVLWSLVESCGESWRVLESLGESCEGRRNLVEACEGRRSLVKSCGGPRCLVGSWEGRSS